MTEHQMISIEELEDTFQDILDIRERILADLAKNDLKPRMFLILASDAPSDDVSSTLLIRGAGSHRAVLSALTGFLEELEPEDLLTIFANVLKKLNN